MVKKILTITSAILFIILMMQQQYIHAHMSGKWIELKPTGIPPTGNVYHSAAAVGETLYICGGYKNHNHTHYYDMNTNQWFEEPDAALFHNALAADMDEVGGVLYLFGGKDTTSGKADGKGYVNDLYAYKTGRENMIWEKIQTAKQPLERDGHATTTLKGFVFMFGGWDETKYLNDLHVFDTTKLVATGTGGINVISWSELTTVPNTPLPPVRNSHSMVTIGSSLLVYGGFTHDVQSAGPWVDCGKAEHGCTIYDDLWSLNVPGKLNYNTPNAQWTKLLPGGEDGKPEGRWEHDAATIGDEMYLFGGLTAENEILKDLWAYSKTRNIWRRLVDRETGVFGHIMKPSSGSLYVFGGNKNIHRETTNALWKFETILEEEEGEDGGGDEGIIPAGTIGDTDVCFKNKNGESMQTYVTMTFWILLIFFISFIVFLCFFIKNGGGGNGNRSVGRKNSYLELHTKNGSSNDGEKPYTAL